MSSSIRTNSESSGILTVTVREEEVCAVVVTAVAVSAILPHTEGSRSSAATKESGYRKTLSWEYVKVNEPSLSSSSSTPSIIGVALCTRNDAHGTRSTVGWDVGHTVLGVWVGGGVVAASFPGKSLRNSRKAPKFLRNCR